MKELHIARIQNGIVINVEVADDEWISEHSVQDGQTFVTYTDDEPAHIGFGWSPEQGFAQPTEPDYPLPTEEEMSRYLAENAE